MYRYKLRRVQITTAAVGRVWSFKTDWLVGGPENKLVKSVIFCWKFFQFPSNTACIMPGKNTMISRVILSLSVARNFTETKSIKSPETGLIAGVSAQYREQKCTVSSLLDSGTAEYERQSHWIIWTATWDRYEILALYLPIKAIRQHE